MPAFILILFLACCSTNFGVRWQAQRDTALDTSEFNHLDPKRRRSNAATPAGLPPWGPRRLPAHSKTAQSPKIEASSQTTDEWTTVHHAPVRISGEKDKYHSLHFSVSYGFLGRAPQKPAVVEFKLISVVKARKLTTDLYVLFVVDGETIFLSSSRSAIKNPVRGRRWVGERLVFRMPYETLLKVTKARKFAIKMDAITFEVDDEAMEALRGFAAQMDQMQ